eukprot:Skav202667  [mRNA]  locus=scaffold1791:357556:358728:+ [translate_table: standard]
MQDHRGSKRVCAGQPEEENPRAVSSWRRLMTKLRLQTHFSSMVRLLVGLSASFEILSVKEDFEPSEVGKKYTKLKRSRDPWYQEWSQGHAEASSSRENRPKNKEGSNAKTCFCGLTPVRYISRTEKNFQRPFLSCPKEAGSRCHYFMWIGDKLDRQQPWRQEPLHGPRDPPEPQGV